MQSAWHFARNDFYQSQRTSDANRQWRPGQFLTAQLPTGAASVNKLAVPASAVQMVDGQPTVYMLTKKKNTFKVRDIAVGQPINEAGVRSWLLI